MTNGLWLLPSLDRAKLLKEFFEAYYEAESSTGGLVLVDNHDLQKEEYQKIDYPPGWRLVLTESICMGDKVREVWDQVKDLDWVGILNDDHKPRTKKWDQAILSQLTGTNVVSTNDGPTPDKPWNAPNRICGAIAFSGGVLRTLGYMFPEGLQHLYSDDVWGLLFGRAQCAQVIMDVCVEHDHAYKDPKKRDATYNKINGNAEIGSHEPHGGLWDSDRKAFIKWHQEQSENDIAKLVSLQPKTGLMIATPFHDNKNAVVYTIGLVDMAICLTQNNIYFEMARVVGSSLVTHARNSLVDMFLRSKCQKILFIDSDQGWDRNTTIPLFKSSRRIIAGITPHKRFPINLNFEPLEEDFKYFKDPNNKSFEEFKVFAQEKMDVNGDIQVARAGTGFMMIDRSVFEILGEKVKDYYAFDNRTDAVHKEFFLMGEHEKRFRGEDWRFCMMAKEADIPIFINANSVIPHLGNYLFSV